MTVRPTTFPPSHLSTFHSLTTDNCKLKTFLTSARWLLLAAIVVSAWLFGGTRDWTVEVIRWLLLTMTALFLVGLLLRRRWPRVPWFVAVPSLFLLLQGWFMMWNASRRFIPEVKLFVDTPQRITEIGLNFRDIPSQTSSDVACSRLAIRMFRSTAIAAGGSGFFGGRLNNRPDRYCAWTLVIDILIEGTIRRQGVLSHVLPDSRMFQG